MTTAPVIILIAKKGCSHCDDFAPDDEAKIQRGYKPGQLSEWEMLINDPEIGRRYWSREFHTGIYPEGRRTLPEQFSYVQFVPKILVATGPAYTAAFDLETGAVKSTAPVATTAYEGEMKAGAIKAWLLNNYSNYV